MLVQTDKYELVIDKLNVSLAPKGEITKYWLHIATDGMGVPIHIPIIVARGKEDGKVLGLTAAVHGNELNGIPMIQRLFNGLDVNELKGTIVGVPVVNVPSLLRKKRGLCLSSGPADYQRV
jgi:predicted deacylase